MQNNQTQASIDETEVISNDEGGNVQIRSPVSKKKKKSDDDSLIEVLKQSISLRENRERKLECDSDRLFMLSLLDDFRKIPEDRRLSTKMELMDVIKERKPLEWKLMIKVILIVCHTFIDMDQRHRAILAKITMNTQYYLTMDQVLSEVDNTTDTIPPDIQHNQIMDQEYLAVDKIVAYLPRLFQTTRILQ